MSSEEKFKGYVKEKVVNSIKRHSKWLMNKESTGIVLYFDTASGPVPVINSKGQKIEFFFTDQPDQDPNISTTELKEPVTGRQLTDFEKPAVIGYGETEVE